MAYRVARIERHQRVAFRIVGGAAAVGHFVSDHADVANRALDAVGRGGDEINTVALRQAAFRHLVAFARPICEELERGRYDVSSLTVVVSGGAVLSPAMKERLLDLLPQAFILDAGGSSETGTQMSAFSSKVQAADLAIFTPNAWTCVVDDRRERLVDAGHTEIGWLGKRGPIPLGYLGDA